MPFNVVIDSVEKLFRYFIPGFTFAFLLRLSFPSWFQSTLNDVSDAEFYIYALCTGMIIYCMHRILILGPLEFFFYLFGWTAVENFADSDSNKCCKFLNYPKALGRFWQTRHNLEKKSDQSLSSYLFYVWSMHHYLLILSELLFLFSCWHEPSSFMDNYQNKVFLLAVLISIPSVLLTTNMYVTEKHLYDKK